MNYQCCQLQRRQLFLQPICPSKWAAAAQHQQSYRFAASVPPTPHTAKPRDTMLRAHLCCQLLAPACAKDVECLMCCCCQVGWQAGAEAVALTAQALVITHLHTTTQAHKTQPQHFRQH